MLHLAFFTFVNLLPALANQLSRTNVTSSSLLPHVSNIAVTALGFPISLLAFFHINSHRILQSYSLSNVSQYFHFHLYLHLYLPPRFRLTISICQHRCLMTFYNKPNRVLAHNAIYFYIGTLIRNFRQGSAHHRINIFTSHCIFRFRTSIALTPIIPCFPCLPTSALFSSSTPTLKL